MLFSLLSGGSLRDVLISLLLSLPAILFALCVHEAAHGYVAYKCGDGTAYHFGRITLNPAKHIDPAGFLCMLVFGYGWAKPVPINTRNFRNPKRGMALSALAGPLSNALVGVVSALLFGVSYAVFAAAITSNAPTLLCNILYWTSVLFQISATINFLYMGFNMIPLPPFDGSRVALAFLPAKTYFGIMKYERQIMFGLLIAILALSRFGFSPFSILAEWLTGLIANPVFQGVFSLLS